MTDHINSGKPAVKIEGLAKRQNFIIRLRLVTWWTSISSPTAGIAPNKPTGPSNLFLAEIFRSVSLKLHDIIESVSLELDDIIKSVSLELNDIIEGVSFELDDIIGGDILVVL